FSSLKHHGGRTVPKIVQPCRLGEPSPPERPLEPPRHVPLVKRGASFTREDDPLRAVAVAKGGGSERLAIVMSLQRCQGIGRQVEHAAAPGCLRLVVLGYALPVALERPTNADRASLQVNVVPGQAQQLPLPCARVRCHGPEPQQRVLMLLSH